MRGTGECKYCGTQHRRGQGQCPPFGNAAHAVPLITLLSVHEKRPKCTSAKCHGHLISGGPRWLWFVHMPLHQGHQRCQLDTGATCNVMNIKDKMRLASRMTLQLSLTKLKLCSGDMMNSMGLFSTQCVIRGKTHKLDCGIWPEAIAFRFHLQETWPDTLHHPWGAE